MVGKQVRLAYDVSGTCPSIDIRAEAWTPGGWVEFDNFCATASGTRTFKAPERTAVFTCDYCGRRAEKVPLNSCAGCGASPGRDEPEVAPERDRTEGEWLSEAGFETRLETVHGGFRRQAEEFRANLEMQALFGDCGHIEIDPPRPWYRRWF